MIQPLPPPADTPLAQAIAPRVSQHPDLTGIYTLSDGRSAFATRGLLVEAAHATLDVQYYIWHDDLSGVLLLEALQRAAERGVRVRLLLDDNGIAGLDPVLVALDAHPNLEVRLYNPFPNRRFKPLGYLTEFRRLNRRMHNKSLTVDGVATIIGGRNIGDEYFGASEGVNFADLDVLAVGQVVGEVSSLFERYWGSASAYPLAAVVRSPPGDAAALLRARYDALGGEAAARGYLEALDRSPLVKDVVRGDLPFDWVTARMVADDPEKTLARGTPGPCSRRASPPRSDTRPVASTSSRHTSCRAARARLCSPNSRAAGSSCVCLPTRSRPPMLRPCMPATRSVAAPCSARACSSGN